MRVQDVVLPILRAALPGVSVVSWVPGVDHRDFPMVSVRRSGGVRHDRRPEQLDLPVLSIAAYSQESGVAAEDLYDTALEALYASVAAQNPTEGTGYLHSLKEVSGGMQTSSPYPDCWCVTGQVRIGIRPV